MMIPGRYKEIIKVFFVLLIYVVGFANARAQEITVHGTVKDAKTDSLLPGVNISVKGKPTIGNITNKKGTFELNVPSENGKLIFSFVGYKTKTVPIKGRKDLGIIKMKQQAVSGENLVVTAFGEERNEISVVGAVQSIKSPDEELKIPSSSLTNAFAGRMAGVTAFQRSGQPGANASQFFIRGISTFSGSAQPLIIIDGVEASSADLNALSPEVIESFSILKDATATAVYGSRGANGVMIVKTKTGRNLDHPKIHVKVENSITSPTRVPDFADGVTYMGLYNEAIRVRNSGQRPYKQDKIEGTRQHANPYIYPDVDWYDKLFKKRSMRQNVNVNILGGGNRVQYFMSGTFNRANGMLRSYQVNSYNNNVRLNRYAFQNNLDIDVSPTTKASLKLNTKIRKYHRPAESVNGIFGLVMQANPVDFPVIYPNSAKTDVSNTLYGGKGGGRYNSGYRNPFAEMVSGYGDDFSSTVMANVHINQDLKFITKGLSLKGIASFKNWSSTSTSRSSGYNQYQIANYQKPSSDTSSYNYSLNRVGERQDLTLGTGTSNRGDRTIYFQARLNYDRDIAGKHHISAMALYNQTNYNVNNPAGLIQSLPQRTMGYAGRLNYNYDNTYLAELDFGYNGSEAFEGGHRFGFFPTVAGGIVLSNEKFWEPLKSTINKFKLRASWGKTGNDDIGGPRFVYQSAINLHQRGYTTGRDQNYGRSGFSINRFANPGLTWEIDNQVNFGLDLGLFNSLSLTVDVYREKRSKIFLQRNTIPASFGVYGTDIYGNLGKVLNKGVDAQIDFSKSLGSDFYMALKGTFTYAHNKVTARDEPPFLEHPNLSSVGHPVNYHLGLKAERLFIDRAEINHSPDEQLGGQVDPGDIKYTDVSGDGRINSDDRVAMGYPSVPEIEYGIGPSFKYKNWDLSFLLQGVAHTSFFMNGFEPFGSSSTRNVMQFIADDHWSPDNQDIYAGYPRLSINNNPTNTANSSFWLRNASFIKLRNAEIGYTYKNARIYLNGLNLFIISPFDKWDPEQGGGNGLGYPTQRTINVGIQLDF